MSGPNETNGVSGGQRHKRGYPCPVCGGWEGQARGQGKRCTGYTSADGKWAFCSREEHGGTAIDAKDGGQLYRHLLRDESAARKSEGPEAVYEYRDEHGTLRYSVVRWPGKRFVQCRPDESSGKMFRGQPVTWNLTGVERLIYRLPELAAAPTGNPVYVVEGEKDVESIRSLGRELATCNSGGAGKWRGSHADAFGNAFMGRAVIVIADNDDVGRRHAREVAADLRDNRGAASVTLRQCPAPHKDVTDHLLAGGKLSELVPLSDGQQDPPAPKAVPVEPPSSPATKAVNALPIVEDEESDGRPFVQLGTDLHRVVDEAERVIADERAGVYVRTGCLVRVVRDTRSPSGVVRAAGAATIRRMVLATTTELLTRYAKWGKWDGRSEKIIAAIPGQNVASALLERGEWPSLRPLVGILETPALRPDGSVIQVEGYDRATGYLLRPNEVFPMIAELPSLADAERARDRLFALVKDFPFAEPIHRTAWLSALLTLFARPAIDGCTPLFAIDATTPGTGKGKLADVISLIASGRDAAKASLSHDDDEFRKRISALLVEGDAFAVLDNVSGVLRSSALDACLTSTVWKDRMLGVTASLTVDNRLVWAVTANNLQLGADTARRTIHVRLETSHERPELRDDFEHEDLLSHVRANRASFVSDALTILVAHAVAGRPRAGVRNLGGFERWSQIVASACAWCGAGDPCATQAGLATMGDATRSQLEPLFAGLARLTHFEALSAKGILSKLYPAPASPDGYEELREAIESVATPSGKATPTAVKLGQALRVHRGRIIGGRTLIADRTRLSTTLHWRIVVPGQPVDAPPVPEAAPVVPELPDPVLFDTSDL